MGSRGLGEKAVYRGTFFNLAVWSASGVRQEGEESVATPPLYHREGDAAGNIVDETPRPIDPMLLPKAVQAAYEKWNPNGLVGRSGHYWMTEVPRGKARVYQRSVSEAGRPVACVDTSRQAVVRGCGCRSRVARQVTIERRPGLHGPA